ncbi:unnamed protein product [Pieris brassicae]|uniref:Carboxylic ester hydrolase n=1 Tax=Pieris brassicae TaxID=7116 RepID=A0A9P0XAJ5_PIEBR|nr:unnamed protein product [Pieris brassicae]
MIVIFCLLFCLTNAFESRIVNTSQGPVKGYKDDGLYSFYSVPYARAPTGRDRFKAPLPAVDRPYVLEAVDKGIVCPQQDLSMMVKRSLLSTEDCLIANIFVPDTTKTNLPVIVYVHGGGYIACYGNLVTYKNLVKSKDVIVVTFNYRLGAHGFLCLGTEDIPGNAGMKDQVALLRWVKENIGNFGGDPEEVTLAGYSAGSSSVDLLMLSDTTKGLFKRVIPESGANTAAWSVQTDPIKNAQEYGQIINFTDYTNLDALQEFYKTVSYEILTSGEMSLINRTDSTFLMSPCIERETDEEEFLTESPVNILKSGNYNKVPMLYGFAAMEGLMRKDTFDQWKHEMNEDFVEFLPPDLQFKNDKEKAMVAERIKKFYFGNEPVSNEKVLSYVDFFSDVFFTYATLRSVKLHVDAGHDKIYLYEYSFVHDDIPTIPYTKVRGATHCAQSSDVGDGNFTHIDEGLFPKAARDMKKTVRDLWYNFVSTGQPVPEGSDFPSWPPVGKDWTPYMVIDNPMRLSDSLLKERTQFWDEIYSKHYRQPSPPSIKPTIDHSEL